MKIICGGLEHPVVIELLRDHLRGMARHSPPESVHALGLAALKAPEVSFWTAWDGNDLLGCGALREIDPGHGEIKSMRTAPAHLGKGVGRAMLAHIIRESRRRGYRRLSLETGSGPAFEPALRLYEQTGFEYCEPFAEYRPDPFSRFMTLRLD